MSAQSSSPAYDVPIPGLIAAPAVEPAKGSALHGTGIQEIETSSAESEDDDQGEPTPEQLAQMKKTFKRIQRKLESRELKRRQNDSTLPYEPDDRKIPVSIAEKKVSPRIEVGKARIGQPPTHW